MNIVAMTGVTKEKGFLYFLDKDGDVSRSGMTHGPRPDIRQQKVAVCGVVREEGFLYFIDKQGHVARAAMRTGPRKAALPPLPEFPDEVSS